MDKVKKTSWTKRYFLIEEIAHDLKDIAVKRGKSIYIHDKWISFKGKVSKRKKVQMEKMSDFDKSCCVSTAVKKPVMVCFLDISWRKSTQTIMVNIMQLY